MRSFAIGFACVVVSVAVVAGVEALSLPPHPARASIGAAKTSKPMKQKRTIE